MIETAQSPMWVWATFGGVVIMCMLSPLIYDQCCAKMSHGDDEEEEADNEKLVNDH